MFVYCVAPDSVETVVWKNNENKLVHNCSVLFTFCLFYSYTVLAIKPKDPVSYIGDVPLSCLL